MSILEDRAAIYDVLVRYCRLVDEDAPPDLTAQEIFTEDAVDEHGYGEVVGREALAAMFGEGRIPIESGMHSVSNVTIAVNDDDTAQSTSYYTAYHWLHESKPAGTFRPADFVGVGIYEDTFRRGVDGWRIAHRKLRVLGPGGLAVGAMPQSMTTVFDELQRQT